MKSGKAILADYDPEGNPAVDKPKRMTKRMRKRFFGRGPSGKFGFGRKTIRNHERILRSAEYKKKQREKAKK